MSLWSRPGAADAALRTSLCRDGGSDPSPCWPLFFAFPPEVRRVIYTTNAIESANARLRKILKTRGHFPTDDAATKLIWLALRNITAEWGRASNNWKTAMNQFAILFDDRFTRMIG
jgi:transposase-like protein